MKRTRRARASSTADTETGTPGRMVATAPAFFEGPAFMGLLSSLGPMVLIVLGLFLNPHASFSQWDNLEIFLPSILFVHRRILHGELPLWNQFQNLGEPIHAQGVGGVFYAPYTICTWGVDAMGWSPRSLMDAIVVVHAGLAGLGLYALCRVSGVRPLFAMVAAVSGTMSGFALFMGSVWIHVMPTLAWSAWALWAAIELIEFHRPARAALVGALSLALPFHAGHIQPAVYLWVVVALFAAGHAFLRKRFRERLPWLAAVCVAAALLAMPSVLPTAAWYPDTERAKEISSEPFGSRGVHPAGLLGLLLPVLWGNDGFIEKTRSDTLHAGAWLLPALLGAGARLLRDRRRRGIPKFARDRGGTDLSGGFALNAGLAVAVMVLSLGDHAPIYAWTRQIPIWSSFRWPFKLFVHALPFLLAAGAIALELLARERASRPRRIFFVAAALAALLVWIVIPAPASPGTILTGVLGLIAILSLAWVEFPAGRVVLGLAAFAAAGGMMFVTHRADRVKTYAGESVGDFDPRALGITNDFRCLPVSFSDPPDVAIEEFGLFHSATLDGYHSLTGHRFALTSRRLLHCLPTGGEGLIPRAILGEFLQSRLMRSYNARYVLAGKHDGEILALLEASPGYRRIAETPQVLVFANDDALPRFYFATEVRPYAPREFYAGMVENRSPGTAAFVDGAVRVETMPHARVVRSEWGHERVAAEIAAPEGGFVVVSMSYSPDWIAGVDGVRAATRITNCGITGLYVPRGARRLVLTYQPRSLRLGLRLAAVGAVVLILTTAWLADLARRRPKAESV